MAKEFIKNVVIKLARLALRVSFHARKKTLPGVKTPVIVLQKTAAKLSIAAVDRKTAEKYVQLLGGCLVNNVKPEALDAALAANQIPQWAHSVMTGLPEYYQILLCKESIKGLSKEEVKAIYLHEVAHIVNGDLHSVDAKRIGSVILEDSFEFAADDYAVNVVGKAVMKTALEKVTDNLSKYLVKEGMAKEAEEMKKEIEDPASLINRRFARLS